MGRLKCGIILNKKGGESDHKVTERAAEVRADGVYTLRLQISCNALRGTFDETKTQISQSRRLLADSKRRLLFRPGFLL